MTYYTDTELNYILESEGFKGDIDITDIDENWELEGVYYDN